MEKIKRVKASQIPDATNIEGFKAFGIKVNTDGTIDNVKVPMDLLKGNVGLTAFEVWNNENGGDKTYQDYIDFLQAPAVDAGVYAQAQGDYAKAQGEAIQDDLALKANHGYDSSPKTLKEVEDNAGVKIENIVENGDFRNGTTGWNLYNGAVFEDGYIKIVGETRSTATFFIGDVNISGDKIYSSVYIGENTLSVTPYIYDPNFTGGSLSIITPLCPIGYTGQTSVITSVREGVGGGQQVLLTSGAQTRTGYFTFKDLITINLTQTFGAGNEPTEKEMNLLISTLGIDYFEGEITIPAQKVMQWQLALIRKNKNAIIALGGTII